MDYRAARGTLAMQFNAVKRHFGKKISVTGTVIDTFISMGDSVNILDRNQMLVLTDAEVIGIKRAKGAKNRLAEASPAEEVTLLLQLKRPDESEGISLRGKRIEKGFFLAKPSSF